MGEPIGGCSTRQDLIEELEGTTKQMLDLANLEMAAITNLHLVAEIDHIQCNLEQLLLVRSELVKHCISHRRKHG